jgi:transketolase
MIQDRKTMRDAFIEGIYRRMSSDRSLFFLSADLGSPKLDKLREEFCDRFINVGIAEQNLINIATGLAIEGFTVYAYAIAPFLTMRAYEQIRNNLSLMSHTREVNVNMVGVGAGLSYDVSGPTHHSIEDLSIIRTLPNLAVFSPSDWILAERFIGYTIDNKNPKYLRFDGKPLPSIYEDKNFDISDGFFELIQGSEVCVITTGFMTHTGLCAVDNLRSAGIDAGLVDIFLLKPLSEDLLFEVCSKYKSFITIEEAFLNKGGLDSIVAGMFTRRKKPVMIKSLGFGDSYVFDIGSRAYLHKLNGIDEDGIISAVKTVLQKG